MSNINNLRRIPKPGLRCGSVVCIEPTEQRHGNGYVVWRCSCICGDDVFVPSNVLAKGRFISCGCDYRERAQSHALSQYRNHYRSSAKARGHTFDLSKTEFGALVSRDCSYCGNSPKPKSFANYFPNKKLYSQKYLDFAILEVNGIDRVDNKLGYVTPNCRPCCSFCNYAKRDRTAEEFEQWLFQIAVFRNAK